MNHNSPAFPDIQISTEPLALLRGARVLFRDIEFSLTSGSLLALRGHNGSGKTSLLRIIAGLLQASKGKVLYKLDGHSRNSNDLMSGYIHYLGHKNALTGVGTPLAYLKDWARIWSVNGDVEAISRSALEKVELVHAAVLPIPLLSAGQARRLALARLLITERPIWILDEPMSSLDAQGKAWLSDIITRHRAKGGIVFIALHGDLDLTANYELEL